MISRRQLLIAAAKSGPFTGASLAMSGSLWHSLVFAGEAVPAQDRIEDLLLGIGHENGVQVSVDEPHLPACGAHRGHGAPQPKYAFESHLDNIAKEMGIDPLDIRLLNLVVTVLIVFSLAYATHCTYANIKFRGLVKRASVAMNGRVQEWLED